METKITIMRSFFEDPDREFQIRELSRLIKINHITVRKYLNKFVNEGLLIKTKFGHSSFYRAHLSRDYINLKIYYNLNKIWSSGLIEELLSKFEIPTITLFGSYAQADDRKNSDIDLCIISNVKRELDLKKYEKKLKGNISLHIFNKKEWDNTKKKNPNLINSICNGIVLSGELEVI